ncbi:hypothetical protein SUGI_0589770 [Cryptomeria japonica]|nr:hypothetical protein SUGI_0589770 [Cryptomeria japonica]
MASKATAIRSALFLAVAAIAAHGSDNTCVYSVYIRTGSIFKAGTDSNISLAVGDTKGGEVVISDLVSWGGLMGQNYDYFEMGNLDIFSGRGPCLKGPICSLDLLSDGTGPHHGWYCNYVEVTSTGPHISCDQQNFPVNQWLATDAPPYQLSFSANRCNYSSAAAAEIIFQS